MKNVWVDVISRAHPNLVRHRQTSKNYGLLGGTLICEVWTYPSGDPTGLTMSRIQH